VLVQVTEGGTVGIDRLHVYTNPVPCGIVRIEPRQWHHEVEGRLTQAQAVGFRFLALRSAVGNQTQGVDTHVVVGVDIHIERRVFNLLTTVQRLDHVHHRALVHAHRIADFTAAGIAGMVKGHHFDPYVEADAIRHRESRETAGEFGHAGNVHHLLI